VVAIILTSIFIALAGFYVIKGIISRILSISSEAKVIAAGDLGRKLEVKCKDEIGDLEGSLNQLTQRIRSNIDELKIYKDRTNEIDLEIQKRLFVFSTLLQISSLILQGAKLEEVLKVTIVKSKLLAKSTIAYLFFREETGNTFLSKVAEGINSEQFLGVQIQPQDPVFCRVISEGQVLIIDSKDILQEGLRTEFYREFGIKNTLAMPVFSRGSVFGILGIGNSEDQFLYKKDDIELLDIFVKQLAIALENDLLSHRLEKLEIKDRLTGLYNESFIRNRLGEEIRRAITYQRPCAFVLLNIDDFSKVEANFGSAYAQETLKKIAYLIRDSVTEIDRVARTANNEFAIVLPERNKRQAKVTSDEIRKKVELSFGKEDDANKKLTVSGGVSENPLDGVTAEELVDRARDGLRQAKSLGKNRILG
ncbi:MAG: diguanylate cyclase, partial [Candidatus Omnitrophica bacterium]|nr:diguanylate cyclase [Candidatus Omnitrophota bacterium]